MTENQFYYETMYILRPDIAEEEVNNHIEKYNKLLVKLGGKVLDSQMRGKRRLAYQISKHREGIYVQLSHQGDGQHIAKIEKAMRLSEDVIRYMTVKQEGPLPTPRASSKNNSEQSDQKIETSEKKSEETKQNLEEKNKSKKVEVKESEKVEVKESEKVEVKESEKVENKIIEE